MWTTGIYVGQTIPMQWNTHSFLVHMGPFSWIDHMPDVSSSLRWKSQQASLWPQHYETEINYKEKNCKHKHLEGKQHGTKQQWMVKIRKSLKKIPGDKWKHSDSKSVGLEKNALSGKFTAIQRKLEKPPNGKDTKLTPKGKNKNAKLVKEINHIKIRADISNI